MEWTLREAHNAYIDAVLSVGLIGVVVAPGRRVVGLAGRRPAIAQAATPAWPSSSACWCSASPTPAWRAACPAFTTFLADSGPGAPDDVRRAANDGQGDSFREQELL